MVYRSTLIELGTRGNGHSLKEQYDWYYHVEIKHCPTLKLRYDKVLIPECPLTSETLCMWPLCSVQTAYTVNDLLDMAHIRVNEQRTVMMGQS